MTQRAIIEINQDLCNGCGQCASACAEGAIAMVDGKATLVREDYCDGLGACLGECPTGALKIVTREAPEFDEAAVAAAQGHTAPCAHTGADETPAAQQPAGKTLPCGCPGTAERTFGRGHEAQKATTPVEAPSELTHWPIQLKLANPDNPVFHEADLLIAADCTAFALGAFHRKLLRNRSLVIACPKLDDHTGYVEKLTAMFRHEPRSITVARMEVPCCSGLTRLVREAAVAADCSVPVREIIISVDGEIGN